MSDHTLLLLQGQLDRETNNFFHFENFWVHMDGFKEAVQTAWNRPVTSTQPLKHLQIKMARTAKSLKNGKNLKLVTPSSNWLWSKKSSFV